jgi:hypothetical protein
MPVGLTYPPQGLNTLTNPTIQGTVSAGTGLTMPTFTAGGDILLGANKLKTTNLLLKEGTSEELYFRNAADDAYIAVRLSTLTFGSRLDASSSGLSFNAANIDGAFLIGQARDTGVGRVEVARLQGANWAHLLLTRARFGTTALTADADHRGGLYVEEGGAGVADKLYWIAKNSLDGYEAVQVAVAS